MSEQNESPATCVFDRIYKPAEGSTLHHYCDSHSLLAILQSGKLRFSDANMMNDGSEGRYGYGLFEKAANLLLENASEHPMLEGLSIEFFDRVDALLSPKQLYSHPVIACFSKKPDVLSQWRAYARDGQGWSIGFAALALAAMPVTLLEVLYDPEQQQKEVKNHLAALFKLSQAHDEAWFTQQVALLGSWLHAYKDPTFAEEQEVRAIHELRVDSGDSYLRLVDEGGVAGGEDVPGETVQFRTGGNAITSFIDLPFRRGQGDEILDLWYGPRNVNGPGNSLYPLAQAGHHNVQLRSSESFYRG